MEKFKGVVDHAEGTLKNRNSHADISGLLHSWVHRRNTGSSQWDCGRCSAEIHGLLWMGLLLDSCGIRLGKEARLDTVHSLKVPKGWDLSFILLSGTAVRFGGHSYIWYQHSQAGSWHMHFRLKTHQHHAVVFHANGTDHATLEVCMAVQGGFSPQFQKPYSLKEGDHGKNMQNYVPLVICVAERLGKTKWQPSTVWQLLQSQLGIVLCTCKCMCWSLVWLLVKSSDTHSSLHNLPSSSLFFHSSLASHISGQRT